MSLHLQINIFGTQLHIDTILNFRISAHWCKGATTCVYQSSIKLGQELVSRSPATPELKGDTSTSCKWGSVIHL